MITIELTPADAIELRCLLQVEIARERRFMDGSPVPAAHARHISTYQRLYDALLNAAADAANAHAKRDPNTVDWVG